MELGKTARTLCAMPRVPIAKQSREQTAAPVMPQHRLVGSRADKPGRTAATTQHRRHLRPRLELEQTGRVWRLRQTRSEEHTSELQSLMRISYAVFCLKKKNNTPIYNI